MLLLPSLARVHSLFCFRLFGQSRVVDYRHCHYCRYCCCCGTDFCFAVNQASMLLMVGIGDLLPLRAYATGLA